jgi:hypothetical protein
MFLKLLKALGRHRVILDRQSNEPYLDRYYLFLKDRQNFPFNIFLHKFHKSDPDDLHDHPWNYMTFIVKGGYWEYTPEGKFWRGAGHFRRCTAESYHRIELEPGVECWTIFMPGKQRRDWGFDMEGHWIQHEEYLEARRG